ncbi:MAG: DUF2623 family protein [Candidatus Malihini olakiniferum]
MGKKAPLERSFLSRRYGLEHNRIAEFFTKYCILKAVVYFYTDYDAIVGANYGSNAEISASHS